MLAEGLICLALNVYFEARGESILGQRLVAEVTLNRVKSAQWPNDTCSVVFQPNQFSWTDNKDIVILNQNAWDTAYTIAQQAVATGCIDHFHSTSVSPTWRLAMEKQLTEGNHVFYCQR